MDQWMLELNKGFFAQKFMGLFVWQLLSFLGLIVAALIVEKVLLRVVRRFVLKFAEFRQAETADQQKIYTVFERMVRPFRYSIIAISLSVFLGFLGLPAKVYELLDFLVNLSLSFSVILVLFRMIEIAEVLAKTFTVKTETKLDDLLLPIIAKALKILTAVLGIVFITQSLGFDVKTILAGLGIGGIAFALAAKDTIENIFGSITVLLDNPFNIGDWVVIDKIEGIVEEVGLRSTRIRTFSNSIVTLPNSKLISTSVNNYGRREVRRFKAMVSLTYSTPVEKIESFCEGLRELLRNNPSIDQDSSNFVELNQMNAASLDVLLYTFFRVPDWGAELRARHKLIQSIIKLAEELEVDFAFPTQTLYVSQFDEKIKEPDYGYENAAARGVKAASKNRIV